MKNKVVTMLGIAVLFGGAAVIGVDYWMKGAAEEQAQRLASAAALNSAPKQEFGTIVVARESLSYGSALKPEVLKEISWPADSMPEGGFRKISELLTGGDRVVLDPIEPNEPVLLAKLSGIDGRASLANKLSPGMRAVTIETNEITAVAGFVSAGDRVDILLTHSYEGTGGRTVVETEVVLPAVKILSVDRDANSRSTAAKDADSVTVEVTDDGVRKIATAREQGRIMLSLRAAGEMATAEEAKPAANAADAGVAQNAIDFIKTVSVDKEPEIPPTTKVIVRRGIEAQDYEVLQAK